MSNIPAGCKPFNYEEAKKDLSKVVNEYGYNVPIINIDKIQDQDCFMAQDSSGRLYVYSLDGKGRGNNKRTLFLKDETVVHVNVGNSWVAAWDQTMEGAIKNKPRGSVSIAALTISNGEIIKIETVHKY